MFQTIWESGPKRSAIVRQSDISFPKRQADRMTLDGASSAPNSEFLASPPIIDFRAGAIAADRSSLAVVISSTPLKRTPMKPHRAEEADVLIGQYDPEIQRLIHAARRTLRLAFPGATETSDPQAHLLGYGYGPGYKETVATLILSKTG